MRSVRPLEQILTSRDGPVLVVPPHSHERNRERVRDHLGHAANDVREVVRCAQVALRQLRQRRFLSCVSLVRGTQRRLGLTLIRPSAQGDDAEGEIVGKLLQQRGLGRVEAGLFTRAQREGSERAPIRNQREGHAEAVPKADRFVAPWSGGCRRIEVLADGGLTRPNRSGHLLSPLRRPCDARVTILLIRRDRDRLHVRFRVRLGEADPRNAVTAVAHDDLTDLSQQRRLIGRVHEYLIAVADRSERAVRVSQVFVGALAFGNVLNLRNEVARGAIVVEHERRVHLNPANPAILVPVSLHTPNRLDFPIQHAPRRNTIARGIIRMGNRLEARRKQFLCAVTDDSAERRVDFEVLARRRHERHPVR